MNYLIKALLLVFCSLSLAACGGGGGGGGDNSAPARSASPVIVDSDSDGVIDANDSCPNTPTGNTVDANGCTVPPPDSDADGVIDANDSCPNTPAGDTVDANGCTVPPADSDADGVIDANDLCLNTPTGDLVDPDGCTVPQDDDGDGIIDVNDLCPNTPTGSVVDTNGCSVPQDSDADGVIDANDLCPTTPTGDTVDGNGCSVPQDSDGDGIVDVNDLCPATPIGDVVYTNGCTVPASDSDSDGVIDTDDSCPDTPTGDTVDANGCTVLPLDSDDDGVTDADDSCPDTPAGSTVDGAGCAVILGNITALFNAATTLEADTQFDRGDALVTRFSDRPRTRHAREDQFQAYDHYIAFYFENRSSNIEIVDYVAKGGDTIEMNVRTLFPLNPIEAENRWWYEGITTVAAYASNGVMNYMGFDGTYYNYQKTENINRRLGDIPIRIGDRMEFEVSQFSDQSIPRGQANYYGTAFLYIVGEGIVPWYAEAAGSRFPEDSQKIPEEYWLGGHTSTHYQYTDEPNDHFIQMATNLGYDNGQTFLLGRRVHHSSFLSGRHDEKEENGVFSENAGLIGSHFINERCTDCHERNGGAAVADNGELLDRWVFKVGDANGNPHPDMGRVLQPKNANGIGEGDVSIASWTEIGDGLRTPNYQFGNERPATFSARIAPRLVGLGLLEAIPESSILAREDINDSNGDGISGEASRVIDPVNPGLTRLGRFGWKAATSSVRHQTAAALNTDIGVRTSVVPNPDCGSNQNDCGAGSPLMPDENLDNLVLYLSTLGVRPQRVWQTGVEDQSALQGRDLFRSIGCVDCHTETLQTSAFHPLAELRNQTIHPYSDLLLHDMGSGLADNLGEGVASGSEWRTTPLWGLGLAACVTGGVVNPTGREGDEVCKPHHAYLHDGRARSIDEAIRWHGGESQDSNDQYQGLTGAEQQQILDFLKSL